MSRGEGCIGRISTEPQRCAGSKRDQAQPHPGTYWAHPHTGLDADTGLYVAVIVDDPAEPGGYDAEWIVVLDDWTDGIGKSPQQIYDDLRGGHMSTMDTMPGMPAMGTSALLGGDAGDVTYPYYLVNGCIPAAPSVFDAKPGQRMRIVNAGSDTAFRIALAGHVMTVTHTDGYPVAPTEVDALLLGMGERYDVIVTAGDGVFPLVALAEGRNALGRALLSAGSGTPPDPGFEPPELNRRVGTVDMFTASPAAGLGSANSDVDLDVVELTGSMMSYDWSINGKPYPDNPALTIKQGQRATLMFTNSTMMWHTMHVHGHTFQTIKPDGARAPAKPPSSCCANRKAVPWWLPTTPGLDDPLPQHLPPRRRHDDQPQLHQVATWVSGR